MDIGFLNSNYSCLSGQQGAQNNVTSIKHAFTIAFYFLLRSIKHNDLNIYFEKALKETLQLGGDTDANCAVVCGLMGALLGVRRIPVDMLSILLAFDDNQKGQNRDGKYQVDELLLKNIDKLIASRPKGILVLRGVE
jgi:ADP-ribosylglycohydrolase